jgi:hypothetical protein
MLASKAPAQVPDFTPLLYRPNMGFYTFFAALRAAHVIVALVWHFTQLIALTLDIFYPNQSAHKSPQTDSRSLVPVEQAPYSRGFS